MESRSAVTLTPCEQRAARLDHHLAFILLVLAALLFITVVLEIVRGTAEPRSMVSAIIFGFLWLLVGAGFIVAEAALRRGSRFRWLAHVLPLIGTTLFFTTVFA